MGGGGGWRGKRAGAAVPPPPLAHYRDGIHESTISLRFLQIILGFLNLEVPSSIVKTVKEQTFHNVPIFDRNKTNIERDPFYLAQECRFWTKSKQCVFNKRNSGTLTKRFGFVSKTILERLSFRFSTFVLFFYKMLFMNKLKFSLLIDCFI
jgi:hypothetical protein